MKFMERVAEVVGEYVDEVKAKEIAQVLVERNIVADPREMEEIAYSFYQRQKREREENTIQWGNRDVDGVITPANSLRDAEMDHRLYLNDIVTRTISPWKLVHLSAQEEESRSNKSGEE